MVASRIMYNKMMAFLDKLIRLQSVSKILEIFFTGRKLSKFVLGQANAISVVQRSFLPDNVVWVHVSSLGELAVVRPVIKELRKRYGKHIVLTFFSPSGYEAAIQYIGTELADAEEIYYLPLDTQKNASLFLDYVRPQFVIFAISEIWPNYLHELRKRDIPAFLVSAKITNNSSLCKPYGNLLRQSYRCFTHISCLNRESKDVLAKYHITNVSIIGDPLFDNAIAIAHKDYHNEVIKKFCFDNNVFIAGSIQDTYDLKMVCYLANAYPKDKFIFVPHEIHEGILNQIRYNLNGACLFYSECDENTVFSNIQVLVIDFLGALSSIYRFCKYAYVGGGFTPYLHSVIEPTVYGLPVAFGPRIERKVTPTQMVEIGIGKVVKTNRELDKWYKSLRNNEQALARIKYQAEQYVCQNAGATKSIVDMVMNKSVRK